MTIDTVVIRVYIGAYLQGWYLRSVKIACRGPGRIACSASNMAGSASSGSEEPEISRLLCTRCLQCVINPIILVVCRMPILWEVLWCLKIESLLTILESFAYNTIWRKLWAPGPQISGETRKYASLNFQPYALHKPSNITAESGSEFYPHSLKLQFKYLPSK